MRRRPPLPKARELRQLELIAAVWLVALQVFLLWEFGWWALLVGLAISGTHWMGQLIAAARWHAQRREDLAARWRAAQDRGPISQWLGDGQ